MEPGSERRAPETRRQVDRDADIWRGQISQQVRSQDDRLGELARVVRDLADKVDQLDRLIIGLHARMDDVLRDLTKVGAEMEKQRDADITTLTKQIDQARGSLRNVLIYLLAPLLVAIIAGIVLFVVTGGSRP